MTTIHGPFTVNDIDMAYDYLDHNHPDGYMFYGEVGDASLLKEARVIVDTQYIPDSTTEAQLLYDESDPTSEVSWSHDENGYC
jgi:hypothetical protein